MVLPSDIERLFIDRTDPRNLQQMLDAAKQMLESDPENKGLQYLALARMNYLQALGVVKMRADRDTAFKGFLRQALRDSEKGAEAKSLQCLIFHCCLASAVGHPEWQKKMQELIATPAGWTDPHRESLKDLGLEGLSLPCDSVEGATRDERCRERLKLAKALIEDSETAESMMMEHRKDQAGRLLSVLSQERSAIRPRDWQGRAICENYWHTKIQALSTRQAHSEHEQHPAEASKGSKSRQESQRGKLAGKMTQQKLSASKLDKVLSVLNKLLREGGKAAVSDLLRIPVADLEKKVEEHQFRKSELLGKDALAYWLKTGGMPFGMIWLGSFVPPESYAGHLRDQVLQCRREQLPGWFNDCFGGALPTHDALAEVGKEALDGTGFVHAGSLPTEVPDLQRTAGQTSSGQASCSGRGKVTYMLPITGRDPRMHKATLEFQTAINRASRTRLLARHINLIRKHVQERAFGRHLDVRFQNLRTLWATIEYQAFIDAESSADIHLVDMQYARRKRVMLSGREKEISEESSERLNMRGIQLLKLIQCYGRLCFLQNKSVELRAGDEVLVQAMVEALDVLEGRDDDSSGSQMRASWTWMMSRHRFPCHLLGPDADEPVEDSLERLEDSPNCQSDEGCSERQKLLDIIMDMLWILRRNKVLTSGFVTEIALHILLHSKEHWQCCTQRVCWEDLGQLSRDALMMVAGAALQQLGLCQHLLKDYANARLMIDKVKSLEVENQDVAFNHLRCLPMTHKRSVAYAANQLGSICKRSIPVHDIQGFPTEEEENELVKDFVGAMYNDDKMIPKTMLREPPHISKGDIAKKLNTAKGCLDQAFFWRGHADKLAVHHMTYLEVIANLLDHASGLLAGRGNSQFDTAWESVEGALGACEKESAEFHRALGIVAEQEGHLLASRRQGAKRCCANGVGEFSRLLDEDLTGHLQGEKLEETLQHLSSETLDNLRRVGGTREGVKLEIPSLSELLQPSCLNLVVVEKAVSKILSEAVSDVLLDLLRLEVNGLQVVDLQMEAARLAALECLRTIERRKEEAVLHHFELAAFSCLKDKLDQLVTREDEKKAAAEEEQRRKAEEESKRNEEELLRELEEEDRKKAEQRMAQEEKKRRKGKGAAKNAKLEEERAARENAEQEEAAKREAEEEREREQQQQEQEAMRAKEEAWQRMQKDVASAEEAEAAPSDAQEQLEAVQAAKVAPAEDNVLARRPSQAVGYEPIPLAAVSTVQQRPALSKRRSGRERRGLEASRSGRVGFAPEANGHASAADSNGNGVIGNAATHSSIPPLSGVSGAASGAKSVGEGRRPGSAGSLSGPVDRDEGDAASSASGEHSRKGRGTRCCKLCRDPEHDVASCPQLDDLAADDRKAAVRAYLSRNRQDAEKLLERLRDGRSTEQEGHKRSTKSSRSGKGRGRAATHCLHCGQEDHRCMDCPALSELNQDARALINQTYLEKPDKVEAVLRKYLGTRWAQMLGGEPAAGEGAASQAAEPVEDLFCKLCHKTGHRVEGCTYARGLPAERLQRVVDLACSGKRHYGLNMIVKYWRKSHLPRNVPLVKTLRPGKFCCHCDADDHRIMNCPELQEMDEATRMDMGNAYAEEFWNGKTPEELYHEWLQAYSDRHTISCVLCAEQHSVLNCPQLEGLPLGAYNPIVEAFTAGDIAKALELVDSSRLATAKAETAAQQPSPAPLQLLSAPAPEAPVESRPTQSSQRPSRVTQAAAAAARPLKPGFWKAMKLPAKDPPLGGIRVRADMGADTFQACLHCLDTKHNFKDCPELARMPSHTNGVGNFGALQRAYKEGDLRYARKAVEMAMGCRMCRRTGHWMPKCPRVPWQIKSELEEIYERGPVEAAMKLANNALELRQSPAAPEPSSALPTASEDRPQSRAAPAPTSWAAALKKGTTQEQQQTPSGAQAPMPAQAASWRASEDVLTQPSVSEQPAEEKEEDVELAQDVKASEGVWHLLADDSSQSDATDSLHGGPGSGASLSARPQPTEPTALGGPFFPHQRIFHSAPPRVDSSGIPPELLPTSLSDPTPPAARPLAAAWAGSAGASEPTHATGNALAYRPFVRLAPPGPPEIFPTLPAVASSPASSLMGAATRRPPPGFFPIAQTLQDDARARNQADLEAAMKVFELADAAPAASSARSQPAVASHPSAAPPFQPPWLQPGAASGYGAQQWPPKGPVSAPAPAPVTLQQPQEVTSDDYILGLLGVGGPKPASQQQQQQPGVLPQPVTEVYQVSSQPEIKREDEYEQHKSPVRIAQPSQWQTAGSGAPSPLQHAWGKPLTAAVRAGTGACLSPSKSHLSPSPSRPGPRTWPGLAPPSSSAGFKASAVEREAYLSLHTEEEMSDSEEEEDEETEEDEEGLNAAIQASLQDSKDRLGPLHEAARMQEASQQSMALTVAHVATPGLQNLTGEYNCFLNVIVQCLWHCRAFRSSLLRRLNPQQLQSVPVVWELLGLFVAFAKEEAQHGNPGANRAEVVAPNALREALSELNSRLFSIGEMSDAAEVLNAVYDSLGAVPGGAELVDAVFGLHVHELVHCDSCGRDTHDVAYTQSFYNVSTTALRMQALCLDDGEAAPSLGQALRGVERQTLKSCDTDEGGCGRDQQVRAFLEGTPPAAFMLQLAWESHAESSADIRATMGTIQETLDLGEVYLGLPKEHYIYKLRSMVCYYGAHYHAFVHTGGQWIMFDDANTSAVGSWDAVMHKCQLGKIQPSVLFFELPSQA